MVKFKWHSKDGFEGKEYTLFIKGEELTKQDPEITFSAEFPQSVSVVIRKHGRSHKKRCSKGCRSVTRTKKIEVTSGTAVEITYQYNAQT